MTFPQMIRRLARRRAAERNAVWFDFTGTPPTFPVEDAAEENFEQSDFFLDSMTAE